MTTRTPSGLAAAALTLLGLGLTVALATPSDALAGPPSESPRAMFSPWTAAAEQDGVEAVLTHAAGLGFMSSLELGLAVTTRLQGDDPVNSVLGLLGARLGPLAVGLGLGGVGDGPGTDSTTTRVDWGLALRLSDALSVGFGWQALYSDVDADLDAYDTWSLSTTLRPFRALSLAVAIDRFDTPKLAGDDLNAILRVGLGVRPGTERVTVAADFSHELGGDPWTLGGSVRVMLVPGLVIGGYGAWDDARSEVRAGAFLGLYQGGLALESSVDARLPDGGDDGDADGMSLTTMLKAKSAPYPSLVTDKHLLVKLPIGGAIPERTSDSLLGDGPAPFGKWIQALDVMAHDDDVDGVVLSISSAPSWGQSWELREALERLKAAGKKVYAVMTIGDMRAMYLASVADKVYLHAGGGLLLTGLAITRTYIATLLERLGVNVQIVKFEEYKSAPEALTRTGPSEPAEEQDKAILDGVMAAWMGAVTAGRHLTDEQVDATLKTGPQSMKVALERGLVDGVDANDAIAKAIAADAGEGAQIVDSYRPSPRAWSRWAGAPTVAIVPIVGSIVDGGSAGGLPIPILGDETTGDETFVRAIEAASRDASVLGIVVRVDSGGGSATASDKMYRAVQLAA
ncbi:MAG: S49 family peptidase, partial [Myxococcales bacterium]|nr:S49 family peptidase [Myxococcales bacterium]